MENTFQIEPYVPADRNDFLKLLLELQMNFYSDNAPEKHKELAEEVNSKEIYERYITELECDRENAFIRLAKDHKGNAIGFIIGRVRIDNDLVLYRIGVVEDWFVLSDYRKRGIGKVLYDELKKWFREKNCSILTSATWAWNESSIKMHEKLGFFITEVKFERKL
jgi:GNAT superfamily N-acetyltransferase